MPEAIELSPPAAPLEAGNPTGTPPPPDDPAVAGRIEDAFLLSGLFEDGQADDLLASLQESYTQRLAEKAGLDKARIDSLKEVIGELEELRQREAEETRQLQEEKKENDAKAAELLPRYSRLLERQSARMRDLLAKRPSYPLRRTWNKLNDYREMSTGLAAHLLAEEQQRLELDRTLHQGESERRQWNKKELDRREKFFEGQLAHAEERLLQVDTAVGRLRMLGITRKTTGFLVWAGYLSFAGFGWFVGDSIRSLAGKDSGFMQALITLLVSGLSSLMERLGLGLGLGLLLIGPLLLLAVAFGVFFLADRFLGRFDPRWKTRRPARKSSSLGPWGPFQSSFRDVGRGDYAQMLARMPVLYLWLVVPAAAAVLFGLSGDAAAWTGLSAVGNPAQTFEYTFLGLVLCVAIAAVILLYAVFVVGPRHRRYLGEEAITTRAAILMNVELAAFLAAMIVLVVFPDLLRAAFPAIPSIWQRGATAGIWLLPALGGFAVSYGVIYKGIFRDHLAIKREVQNLFDELERGSSFSSSDGPEESAARWRSGLADLRKEIEEKWEKVDLWTKPAIRFRLRRFRWSTLKELMNPPEDKTAQGSFDITVADVMFEPELVEQVNQVVEEVAEIRQALDGFDARNREITTRLAEIEKENAGERIASLRRQIAEDQMRQWRERTELAHAHHELIARCKNALQVGEFLRRDLHPQELAIVRQTA